MHSGDEYVAIYSYEAEDEDELTFNEGDVIKVTEKDEGWWTGVLNGQEGMFPENYVKPAPKKTIETTDCKYHKNSLLPGFHEFIRN